MKPKVRAFLAALVVALLLFPYYAVLRQDLKGLSLTWRAEIQREGQTVLSLPPLGEAVARTHGAPLAIVVRLDGIHLPAIRALLRETPGPELFPQLERDLRQGAERLVGRSLLFAALLGAGAGVLASRRTWALALTGALGGLLPVAFLFGWTSLSYDLQELQKPQFKGALEAAPAVVELMSNTVDTWRTFESYLSSVADGLRQFSKAVEALAPADPSAGPGPTVLLVSDIHSNPLALTLISRMVEAYHVDLVVDAGDLVDWGTDLEASFLEGIGKLGKPYVLVPGNHDAPEELEQLKKLPNVTVLLGGSVEIQGIRIVGERDPSSLGPHPAVAPPTELEAQAERLRETLRNLPEPPHILVAHHPWVAEQFYGYAPVLVAGHIHRLEIKQARGSTYLNAGTTGAAGIRGLAAWKKVPYSLMVLYFQRGEEGRLVPWAVDTVVVDAAGQQVEVQRTLLAHHP
ncbi:MAG: metallophosphoesterase [Clostridiales bacterium]|nr:metallophosphoesterase [Clostridiales bacterium]